MLSADRRLSLAYQVPAYVAGKMTLAEALAQVDADWAVANPPVQPAAGDVLAEIRLVLHDGKVSHSRHYGDGRRMAVADDGTETVIAAPPAA